MVIVDENFWLDDISDELKKATIKRRFEQWEDSPELTTYNITCTDNRFSNGFNYDGSLAPNAFIMVAGMLEENPRCYDLCGT